jgi:hypothetical protein
MLSNDLLQTIYNQDKRLMAQDRRIQSLESVVKVAEYAIRTFHPLSDAQKEALADLHNLMEFCEVAPI